MAAASQRKWTAIGGCSIAISLLLLFGVGGMAEPTSEVAPLEVSLEQGNRRTTGLASLPPGDYELLLELPPAQTAEELESLVDALADAQGFAIDWQLTVVAEGVDEDVAEGSSVRPSGARLSSFVGAVLILGRLVIGEEGYHALEILQRGPAPALAGGAWTPSLWLAPNIGVSAEKAAATLLRASVVTVVALAGLVLGVWALRRGSQVY